MNKTQRKLVVEIHLSFFKLWLYIVVTFTLGYFVGRFLDYWWIIQYLISK